MALTRTPKQIKYQILCLTNRISVLKERPPEKKNNNIIRKCERQIAALNSEFTEGILDIASASLDTITAQAPTPPSQDIQGELTLTPHAGLVHR